MPLLSGVVVLVTGANGGLGPELVEQALARGTAKVYARARRLREITRSSWTTSLQE
ncbi:NAD(P)-dependent dehydrogenase (short-subunit alcohol dehydrogenase family) [Arthrobacter sp. ES3-54]|jgi:NAD(P)-dependent dehydrogenase (short-subunit alcohol dehydrogenase family)|nr:NAD(P)-dependent dehydrogenase (short-subunit alcohol dehydrogenase family) [Arthrobacter sp. ES3-54]